jgi:hypothetical protein
MQMINSLVAKGCLNKHTAAAAFAAKFPSERAQYRCCQRFICEADIR